MSRISHCQIEFHPHSYGDPDGRLFWWNGQLYRAISPERAPFFTKLFEDGTIRQLVEQGLLVGSELTEFTLDGYGLVVHHQTVPFPSYPNEWSPVMFRDAALAYIELCQALMPRGLVLKDSHPWNILFDGYKPVYVDLTSIRPRTAECEYPPYFKFCRYYLYPLILMSQGKDRIARYLMPEYEGILESDILLLMSEGSLSELIRSKMQRGKTFLRGVMPRRMSHLAGVSLKSVNSFFCQKRFAPSSPLRYLQYLRGELEKIDLPSVRSNHLSNDPQLTAAGLAQNLGAAKGEALRKILSDLKPESVLNIAAGAGWYSKLASSLGSKVVSFNTNPLHASRIYEYARDNKLSILPLVMDFTDPTPARGLASHSSIAAAERLRCELVLGLSLLPHVVVKRKLNFEQIVEGLARFSKRSLILEFATLDSGELSPSGASQFPWYTLENLTNILRKHFRTVYIRQIDGAPGVLLECAK